jgi:hypothetical protein
MTPTVIAKQGLGNIHSLPMTKLHLYVSTKEMGARELDCLQLGTHENGTTNTREDHGCSDAETLCSQFRAALSGTLISLVLVYAGASTIFANFRTFIRLYLIILHRYIARYIALYVATLHRTSTSHSYSYVTTLCHVLTSQPYVTALRRTSMSHLRCIATT